MYIRAEIIGMKTFLFFFLLGFRTDNLKKKMIFMIYET